MRGGKDLTLNHFDNLYSILGMTSNKKAMRWKWISGDNTLALSEFKSLGKGQCHPMVLKGLNRCDQIHYWEILELGRGIKRPQQGGVLIERSMWPPERWCHLVKSKHPGETDDGLSFRFQLLVTPCRSLGKSLNLFGLTFHLEMVLRSLTISWSIVRINWNTDVNQPRTDI